jgi:hypothetical protein
MRRINLESHLEYSLKWCSDNLPKIYPDLKKEFEELADWSIFTCEENRYLTESLGRINKKGVIEIADDKVSKLRIDPSTLMIFLITNYIFYYGFGSGDDDSCRKIARTVENEYRKQEDLEVNLAA